jgi:hypothetical protein
LLLDENIRDKADEAKVLIVKNAVDLLLKKSKSNKNEVFAELTNLNWDTKAKMYGRVVNKHARYNLCFSDEGQESNYEQGMGKIIAWNSVPLLKNIKKSLNKFINKTNETNETKETKETKETDELVGEGNYYYDINKTGIGFHGDAERLKVIGIRLGENMPLCYQWYLDSEPVGTKLKLDLNGGDLYVMSEKTTGRDWKTKSIYTLRHAAGCEKYTNN